MKRYTYLLLLALFVVVSACKTEEVKEVEIERTVDGAAEPGLIHTVYFWLNDSIDADGAAEFEAGVWGLEEIPSVRRMFVGPAAGTPTRGVTDNSFDYALILWFDDVAGHDAYQEHPVHTDFVEAQGPKFKRVQVYDNVLSAP